MEIIKACNVLAFSNSGVTSRQLLFPENSKSQRITITRVVIEPGAVNPPHKHETSEQVWVALQGSGRLLLEEGKELIFEQGDIVRFEEGDVHGFSNTGKVAFEYLSVTSPPLSFRAAYEKNWSSSESKEALPGVRKAGGRGGNVQR
jgi:quercetin dioxygenase-like cupin family protein